MVMLLTSWLLALWLAFQSTPPEAEALRATAPAYLTRVTAAQHLGAARVSGARYGIKTARLLSIAYHESNYVVDLRQREPGHRVSCGVMTPVAKERCDADELTLLGGYLAGAAHLREWVDTCHALDRWRHDVDDEVVQQCALWAYAGGLGFRGFCRAHPGHRGCDAVAKFNDQARQIERALGDAR